MPIPPISQRIKELARKYLKGKLNASEQQEVDEWFAQEGTNETFPELDLTPDQHRAQLLARIHSAAGIVHQQAPIKRPWFRYVAAASILLALLIGSAYLLLTQKPSKPPIVQQVQDIAPGGNKAILTLANGQKVQLTGAPNGLVAKQGEVVIAKQSDGQLSYSMQGQSANASSLFNTIETPRGGKYTLVLADGTIAILDAASSIRYPVVFNGKERQVEITGQVYFEVVHNAAKPFKVSVKGLIVEDLGTKFNVNAYDDEPVIQTTLIEGSIGLTNHSHTTILKPGQQAVNTTNDANTKVVPADIEEVIAWKNDDFIFNNEPLESIMRKVSRWYDVDIQYQQGEKIKETYLGGLTRYSNVSEVLKMLEITGNVRFAISGKTIQVFPKDK